MTNLNNSLPRRWASKFYGAAVLIAVAALIGFADCAYLLMQEWSGKGYRCDVKGFDCGFVLQSSYAKFLGVPWAVWGLMYYALAFVVITMVFVSRRHMVVNMLGALVGIGVVVSATLLYVQAEILHAWCLYCLTSESMVGLILAGFALLWFATRKQIHDS